MNTDNLLSLKDDMVAFIEGHGLKRLPGYVTEDIPSIVWEGQSNPDAWKDFVEMAKHVGAPFVTFSAMAAQVRRQSWLHPTGLCLSGPGVSARNHHRVVRALPDAARRH